MEIIYSTMHNMNIQNDEFEYRRLDNKIDAKNYIELLMGEVMTNESKRKYTQRSNTTEVVAQVLKTVQEERLIEKNKDIIANRLFSVEKETQERMKHLGIKIQKGSLVQSLFQIDGNYRFLISKVDANSYLDDDDLIKKSGLSYEDKTYKNCLFIFDGEEIQEIMISDTNGTQYWYDSFLELEEIKNDSMNTEESYNILERELKRTYKSDQSQLVLKRNQLLGYFKNTNNYSINECIDYIFGEDSENEDVTQKNEFKNKVMRNFEKNNVDTQFSIEPDAIKKRKWKETKQANDFVEVTLNGYDEEIKNNISAIENSQGEKYLKIKVTKEDTFASFNWES